MVYLIHRLTGLLFFVIPSLYYYSNFFLLMIYLFSEDIYLFLRVVNSTPLLLLLLLLLLDDDFLNGFLDTLVILPAILLPIKPRVPSAVFLNCPFRSCFYSICSRFLALSRSFWTYLILKLLPMFLAKDKNPYHFTYILSLDSIEYLIFITDVLFNYWC